MNAKFVKQSRQRFRVGRNHSRKLTKKETSFSSLDQTVILSCSSRTRMKSGLKLQALLLTAPFHCVLAVDCSRRCGKDNLPSFTLTLPSLQCAEFLFREKQQQPNSR